MAMVSSPKYLSLFSGCGGLDAGFAKAGYIGALSVDIDEVALSVHRSNLRCPTQALDLTLEDPCLGADGSIDVLLAGSPCQGFSTSGMRRLDDPRNSLLLVTPRVALKYRPKVVVAENVPGALSGEHRVYWDTLHQTMRDIGYKTHDLHVDSSDFGVAQKRRRVLMIAWLTDALPNFTFKQSDKKVLSDVLNNLAGLTNHTAMPLAESSSDFKIAKRIGQGQKLTNSRGGALSIHTWDIPEVFGKTTKQEKNILSEVLKIRRQTRRRDVGDADPVSSKFLIKTYGADAIAGLVDKSFLRKIGRYHDLTHTFNGKYRRQRMDAHCRTVDTRFGDHRLFLHPTENRAFTVREAARIQGFEDSFVFFGSAAQQFRMIGNAVPPPLANGVAHLVRSLL
jgi:DNA (cytosine-5)-methyltransferase 1